MIMEGVMVTERIVITKGIIITRGVIMNNYKENCFGFFFVCSTDWARQRLYKFT